MILILAFALVGAVVSGIATLFLFAHGETTAGLVALAITVILGVIVEIEI